jgi:hypothetical protein
MTTLRKEKFEVAVQIAPSQGGGIEKVIVEAAGGVDALLTAGLKLEDMGKDRWTLLHCIKVTS